MRAFLIRLLWMLAALASVAAPAAAAEARRHIAILCYHDLSDDSRTPPLTVTPDFLRRQIRRCKADGWTFVSLSELLAHRRHPESLPRRTMVLTFDDGYRSFRERALPILRDEKVPATLAVISGFVDQPPPGMAPMMSWDELAEVARDPLVEIASHSHALHRYDTCNPYRDTTPSMATRRYLLAEARYEGREEYRARMRADLDSAHRVLGERLGRPIDVLVWPYGEHNEMARGLAAQAGFTVSLGVGGREVTPDDLREGCLPRIVVTRKLRFDGGDDGWLTPPIPPLRAADVSLDDVYSPDPTELRARVDQLVRRITALGATHVFLSTCSDSDLDGTFETAWYMNHQVRARADVWSMVAAKLSQAKLRVWARVPTMNLTWAWQQHPEWRIGASEAPARAGSRAADGEVALRTHWPTRLSPDLPEARRAAIDFLTDLAVYEPIDGIVFDDDAALDPDDRLALNREAEPRAKADAIDDLLARCRDAVRAWRPDCRFGRIVDARAVETDGVAAAVAQDFARIVRDHDLTVVRVHAPATGVSPRSIERLARRAVERGRASAAERGRTNAGAAARPPQVMIAIDALDRVDGRWLTGHKLGELTAAAQRGGARNVAVGPLMPADGDVPRGLLETTPPMATGEESYH